MPKFRIFTAIYVAIALTAVGATSISGAEPISFQFDPVPPLGQGPTECGNIGGTISGIGNPSSLKIVIYAHTKDWWVQPLANATLTDLTVSGAWSNWTHLGKLIG